MRWCVRPTDYARPWQRLASPLQASARCKWLSGHEAAPRLAQEYARGRTRGRNESHNEVAHTGAEYRTCCSIFGSEPGPRVLACSALCVHVWRIITTLDTVADHADGYVRQAEEKE